MMKNDAKTKIIALKQDVNLEMSAVKSRFWLWALPVSLLIHGFLWFSADGLKGQDLSPKERIQMVFHTIKPPKSVKKIQPVKSPEPAKVQKTVKKVAKAADTKAEPKQLIEPMQAQKEPVSPKETVQAKAPAKTQRKIRARVKKGLKLRSNDHHKRNAKMKRPSGKRKGRRIAKGRVHRKSKPIVGRADKGKEPQDRVWLCDHNGRDKVLNIHRERMMSEWIKVVPTVLAPFSAQTDIMTYLEGVTQIQHRRRAPLKKKLAPFEMALPNDVLVLDIESPVRMQGALGFLDARCMIGFSYTRKKLFPFTLHHVPMRFTDENGNVLKVVADAIFHRDARIELVQISGDPLLFDEIKLKNSDAISTNIEAHYAVAGVVKDVASFFGIDLWKKKKRKTSKKNRAHLTAKAAR